MTTTQNDEEMLQEDLPQWAHCFSHLAKKKATISYDDEQQQYVVSGDDEKKPHFDCVVQAYDSLQKDEYDIVIDPSVNEHGGHFLGADSVPNSMFLSGESTTEPKRILMSGGESLHKRITIKNYHDFKTKYAPRYYANPENWAHAYNFIQYHPALWHRPLTPYGCQPSKANSTPYSWITDSGTEWVDIFIEVDDNGNINVTGETGAHVAGDAGNYEIRYCDGRMFAESDNIHDIYVQLAAKLAHYYDDDGNEKEDTDD